MIVSTEKLKYGTRVEVRPGVWLDSRLALWLADLRILVVADLHWGYAASHRAHGNLLPDWGDSEIATRLTSLVSDFEPEEMIWLGDSLHTLDGPDAAEAFLPALSCPVTIISGNHDAGWSRTKGCHSVRRADYFFHHGDRCRDIPAGTLEIVGHHHPAISWHDGAGTRLKLPALVASAQRLILPAFSPWAGGVPWERGRPGETLYAIGTKRIFTVPPATDHKEHLAK